MKDLKKLLKKEDGSDKEMRSKMKMDALAKLSDEMGSISGSSIMEKALKPKASVTVATDDPKKLPEALEKAEELVEKMPELDGLESMKEDYLSDDDESEEVESDEMDLDSMSPEQLKEELLKLKKLMK